MRTRAIRKAFQQKENQTFKTMGVESTMPLAEPLRTWYRNNARSMPWRGSRNPYVIWLSEVMLQQTRVAQGLPYFQRFIKRFPDVFQLADADETEIFKLWEGLGYYSRARNLHRCAKEVASIHNGQFPNTAKELESLPGIGPYTAAAIASICFDESVPVVDGNVNRFISRLHGIRENVDKANGKRIIRELASGFISEDPGTMNQALMEFGATVCMPKNPLCESCSFAGGCVAFRSAEVGDYPVKTPKKARRKRYFHYHMITDGKKILVHRRESSDVWKGLFEFPLLESSGTQLEKDLGIPQEMFEFLPPERIQLLSHQEIHARFYLAQLEELPQLSGYSSIPLDELHELAFPRVIRGFMENHQDVLTRIGVKM